MTSFSLHLARVSVYLRRRCAYSGVDPAATLRHDFEGYSTRKGFARAYLRTETCPASLRTPEFSIDKLPREHSARAVLAPRSLESAESLTVRLLAPLLNSTKLLCALVQFTHTARGAG